MSEIPLLLVIFSIGVVIALALHLIEYHLKEPQRKKKDKLSEHLKEPPMGINELTPDEIELIRRKRATESTSNTPRHQS